ncbi:MAG: hypothetical protein WB767_09000 [Nocardioides sp.]
MTAPVPEEENEAYDLDETPPGEHDDDLPDEHDRGQAETATQAENAETSLDQPSQ